jgi:hypothetical protein
MKNLILIIGLILLTSCAGQKPCSVYRGSQRKLNNGVGSFTTGDSDVYRQKWGLSPHKPKPKPKKKG